jgi:hypothetical protein
LRCDDARVRHEAFYTTVAQVLPTLLIAYTVEMAIFFTKPLRVLGRTLSAVDALLLALDSSLAGTASSDSAYRFLHRYVHKASGGYRRRKIAVLSVVPLLMFSGELFAMTALFAASEGPVPWIPRFVCLGALLGATVVIVAMPVVRLVNSDDPDTDPESPAPRDQ